MKHLKNIVIIDDHSIFVEGLKLILQQHCPDCTINTYTSIEQLNPKQYDFTEIDIIISDLELPNEDIFEFIKTVKSKYDTPILIISMHKKLSVINRCIDLGIQGFILKNDNAYLQEAIQTILNGHFFHSPSIKNTLQEAKKHSVILSSREHEVIKLMCQGAGNQKIAEILSLSVETIKTHKRNIKLKIGHKENHKVIEYAQKYLLVE